MRARSRSSYTAIAVYVVAVLILCGASPSEPTTAEIDEFMHLVPGTTDRLAPEIRKGLSAALADFRAVLAGGSPVHAALDKSKPLPADGGTTFWLGPGYELTIVKSLNRVANLDGYMYGPVLTFTADLGSGNIPSISHVSFYSSQALGHLLKQR